LILFTKKLREAPFRLEEMNLAGAGAIKNIKTATWKAIIENGQLRLPDNAKPAEGARTAQLCDRSAKGLLILLLVRIVRDNMLANFAG
jgi:hypothetical protein